MNNVNSEELGRVVAGAIAVICCPILIKDKEELKPIPPQPVLHQVLHAISKNCKILPYIYNFPNLKPI